jgi:hypothetical protein
MLSDDISGDGFAKAGSACAERFTGKVVYCSGALQIKDWTTPFHHPRRVILTCAYALHHRFMIAFQTLNAYSLTSAETFFQADKRVFSRFNEPLRCEQLYSHDLINFLTSVSNVTTKHSSSPAAHRLCFIEWLSQRDFLWTS